MFSHCGTLADATRAAQEFHPEIIRAAPLIQNDKQACRLPASRMASSAVPINVKYSTCYRSTEKNGQNFE